jgi:hypothetical protein
LASATTTTLLTATRLSATLPTTAGPGLTTLPTTAGPGTACSTGLATLAASASLTAAGLATIASHLPEHFAALGIGRIVDFLEGRFLLLGHLDLILKGGRLRQQSDHPTAAHATESTPTATTTRSPTGATPSTARVPGPDRHPQPAKLGGGILQDVTWATPLRRVRRNVRRSTRCLGTRAFCCGSFRGLGGTIR